MASLAGNSAELLVLLLAVFQAGWRYVPVNTHLTTDEVAYILADSGASVLVADDALVDVGVGGGGRRGPRGSRSDLVGTAVT